MGYSDRAVSFSSPLRNNERLFWNLLKPVTLVETDGCAVTYGALALRLHCGDYYSQQDFIATACQSWCFNHDHQPPSCFASSSIPQAGPGCHPKGHSFVWAHCRIKIHISEGRVNDAFLGGGGSTHHSEQDLRTVITTRGGITPARREEPHELPWR